MNKVITNYQDPLHNPEPQKIVKLLIFTVEKLNLALPIAAVKKVINHTFVYSSGLGYVAVTHVEDQEITVIDLHKKLFNSPQMIKSETRGYLILANNSTGEFFGVWTPQTPSLLDIPLSQIRLLPESYRRADTLAIASHVTVIQEQEKSLTVFILDVDQLVEPTIVNTFFR